MNPDTVGWTHGWQDRSETETLNANSRDHDSLLSEGVSENYSVPTNVGEDRKGVSNFSLRIIDEVESRKLGEPKESPLSGVMRRISGGKME